MLTFIFWYLIAGLFLTCWSMSTRWELICKELEARVPGASRRVMLWSFFIAGVLTAPIGVVYVTAAWFWRKL